MESEENMESRYLYRAKRTNTGEWVEGYLSYPFCTEKGNESYYFYAKDSLDFYCRCVVDAATICQCTGLNDKNGELIWENDICRYYNSEDRDGIGIIKNGYVLWKKGTISVKHKMTSLFYLQCHDEWEIIGNIFDNPELLEV